MKFNQLVEKYIRKSAGMDVEDIANKHHVNPKVIKKQLKKGKKVELEHGGNIKKAKGIAMDHLAEKPKYYTALDKAGL